MKTRALAPLILLGLVACTTSSTQDADLMCPGETLNAADGSAVCILGNEISETRFTCPAEMPHAYEMRGVALCSSQPFSDEGLDDFLESEGYPERTVEEPPPLCQTGTSRTCVCPDGDGVEACEDGSYGECICEPAPVGFCSEDTAPTIGLLGRDWDGQNAQPGDTLILAEAGIDEEYTWSLVQTPAASSAVVITPPEGAQHIYLDSPGVYRAEVSITDATGETCTFGYNVAVQLSAGIHVTVSWDTDADLDLHFKRASGDWDTDDDLSFRNVRPDWDGTHPSLDTDDTDGFGPEAISYADPLPELFNIGVDAFQVQVPTNATLQVYIGGTLRAEFTETFTPCDEGANCELWNVADIDWPANTVEESPLGLVRTP